MGSSAAQADYAAFEEKVKRTVYLDNLSPKVTESVVKMALNQFGTVKSVQFIPNYMEPRNIPQCALVEMENSRQAGAVVSEISQFPFMMSGMPRPVRARPAEVEMFDGHPIKPGRRIQCRWLKASDPDFKIATEIKRLTWKHAAEVAFLLKQQLLEEEKLARQQQDKLIGHYKKYEMVDSIIADGTARRLARRYNMHIAED
ncbi:ASI1-immunoprecipitated protein 1 [Alnus glutinosa]|uniref:ASI1-immunoprecipitated protein 1 n=1 Tax=Alnus glutinosa TaxID=3517 RepID=UPI002D7752D3|nr:ASI1-immunoprecipitated protein 1 [Alnus glutinosa]